MSSVSRARVGGVPSGENCSIAIVFFLANVQNDFVEYYMKERKEKCVQLLCIQYMDMQYMYMYMSL